MVASLDSRGRDAKVRNSRPAQGLDPEGESSPDGICREDGQNKGKDGKLQGQEAVGVLGTCSNVEVVV